MFMRRKLPFGILLALVLTLSMTASVGAQEVPTEDLDGAARFRDAGALSDSLVMTFGIATDVPAPPAGFAYEGWLIDRAGDKVSTGVLSLSTATPSIDQTYVSPTGENLIARYDRFVISLEPVPDPDPATPGPIYYSDSIPAGAFTHIGHLVVSLPSNPDGKGIATGLRENMGTARDHAILAQKATTLEAQTLHAHHVINIIEGPGGPNYDISFGDPGDDFGVLNYAADAIKHAGLAKGAASDNRTVVAMADEVIEAANRTIDFATRARDAALRMIATNNDFIVRIEIDNMVGMTTRGLDGTDEDGDGDVGGTGEEGGAKTVYTKSQDMGQFEPVAGPGAPIVGDPLVPVLALAALMAGLVLTTGGGLLLFRRRRRTA